jgi:hypothetical protein
MSLIIYFMVMDMFLNWISIMGISLLKENLYKLPYIKKELEIIVFKTLSLRISNGY